MAEPNSPQNMPEIPSFKSSRQDKEKKGSGAPPLGQGAPSGSSLRLRGPGGAASSVMERLKQLKKKDLIFIASGLSVLLTAPLAEHFMLGPSPDANVLRQGFDQKGAPFSEANPYEPGAGGLAPGGVPGQSNDVVTPLNVRDPASLIFGPGAAQQPTAPSAGGAGEGGKPPEDWKNALKEAARGGAASAAGAPGLPALKGGALSGALRGLSALSGATSGGGPTSALAPISAANVPNRGGGKSNFVTVAAAPGYGGVASHGLDQGSSIEALKRASDAAGNMFPRTGSAADNLRNAALTQIPTGGLYTGGASGPGGGPGNQNPTGNGKEGSKSMGESLAYLRAKMLQEKAIELYYKERSWYQFERSQEIQKELIKLLIDDIVGKAFLEPIATKTASMFKTSLFGANSGWVCQQVTQVGGTLPDPNLPSVAIYSDEDWQASDPATATTLADGGKGSVNTTDSTQIAAWRALMSRPIPQATCTGYPNPKVAPPPKHTDQGDGIGNKAPVAPLQSLTDNKTAIEAFINTNCRTDADCQKNGKIITDALKDMQGITDNGVNVPQTNALNQIHDKLKDASDQLLKSVASLGEAVTRLENVGIKDFAGTGSPDLGILGLGSQLSANLSASKVADADKAIDAMQPLARGAASDLNHINDNLSQAGQSNQQAKTDLTAAGRLLGDASTTIDKDIGNVTPLAHDPRLGPAAQTTLTELNGFKAKLDQNKSGLYFPLTQTESSAETIAGAAAAGPNTPNVPSVQNELNNLLINESPINWLVHYEIPNPVPADAPTKINQEVATGRTQLGAAPAGAQPASGVLGEISTIRQQVTQLSVPSQPATP